MGCCHKRKNSLNKESINDAISNEKLIPNLSISEPSTNRTSIFTSRTSFDSSNISLEDFETLKLLGKGSYGKVYLVKNINSNKVYAMKVLDKQFLIDKDQISHIKTERIALEKLRHKN